jgi:hypothetical protein
MARSTRERYFMFGVAAAVGLWAADRFALTPYSRARATVADSDLARARRRRRSPSAAERAAHAAGVGADAAAGSNPPRRDRGPHLHALRTWAQSAGVAHCPCGRPGDRDHGFVQVVVHAGGTGIDGGAVARCCGPSRARHEDPRARRRGAPHARQGRHRRDPDRADGVDAVRRARSRAEARRAPRPPGVARRAAADRGGRP